MLLSALLEGVTVVKMLHSAYGKLVLTRDWSMSGLKCDSRTVEPRDCFVAIRGSGADGHKYVQDAIQRGAVAVVVEDDTAVPDQLFFHTGTAKILVTDTRLAYSIMASNFYGNPASRLKIAAVTGTNGKTTTTNILRDMLEAFGISTGLIGTIEYRIGETTIPASHTTPDALELQRLFAQMVREGCKAVSMEASSHAIEQRRISGSTCAIAVFTNLTQDHLDYHGTMESYYQSKKRLFDDLRQDAIAVVNRDDAYGMTIAADTKARVITYGVHADAHIRIQSYSITLEGTNITLARNGELVSFRSPFIGLFNVYNAVAAVSGATALGIPFQTAAQLVQKARPVRGRFERIASPDGWITIIDYAHTPDALKNCLTTIKSLLANSGGRIITVFGAGGDRDATKRPLMGSVVEKLSDIVIVTSDNPRTENAEKIMDDIVAGMTDKVGILRHVDRAEAIQMALQSARSGDIVLIAGKGHEEYQVIGRKKVPFSDREHVEAYLSRSSQ